MNPKFKVGDRVRVIESPKIEKAFRGKAFTVDEIYPSSNDEFYYWCGYGHLFSESFLEKVVLPDAPPNASVPPTIKDSGERTEYSTGAVRDCKEGKGRCDLMPLDVILEYFKWNSIPINDKISVDEAVFEGLQNFKVFGSLTELCGVIHVFIHVFKKDKVHETFLDLSKHFEAGAKKYGENNWQKGIPVHSYIDSAIRHYLKYRAGWTDEPHDRAFVWNTVCCIWTMEHHPELDDYTEKEIPTND